jgi:hypothetical protein
MALMLVTYDLTGASSDDYKDLFGELKKCKGWWHYLESSWIVSTDQTADELWDRLEPHVKTRDHVLVVRIDGQDRQGWLPKKAWEWFRRHGD